MRYPQNHLSPDTLALIQFVGDTARDIGVENHSYIVGGAVRDMLLGLDPKDIDIVIEEREGKNSATFAEALAQRLGITSLGSDQYGVAHVGPVNKDYFYQGVNLKGQKLEIVTARKEKYDKTKDKDFKPNVEKGTILDDVYRRDFTISTLLLPLTAVFQPFSRELVLDLTKRGLQDLDNCLLKTPLDAIETFTDDPSRMLRAVRLAVKYDLHLDKDTATAIKDNVLHIQRLPEELIIQEFSKVVLLKDFRSGFSLLSDLGILSTVLRADIPEKALKTALDAGDILPPNLQTRLAVVFCTLYPGIDGWGMERLLKSLNFTNAVSGKVGYLVGQQKNLPKTVTLLPKELRRLVIDLGDNFNDVLLVANALEKARDKTSTLIADLWIKVSLQIGLDGPEAYDRIKVPPLDGLAVMRLLSMETGGRLVKVALEIQKELLLNDPFVAREVIEAEILSKLKL